MKNLLEETLSIMKDHGKSPSDVRWTGSYGWWMPWEDFEKLANVSYDPNHGIEEVYISLLVVGDGWWLERNGYDGAEWWEFKSHPAMPSVRWTPKSITRGPSNSADYYGWEMENPPV